MSRQTTVEKLEKTINALEEELKRYRKILEDIEDGYYEADIAGNLTFFNDTVCRITGYSRDELMGMNNREYMDQKIARKAYKTANRVYRTGVSAKALSWKIIRKDGTPCYVEAAISLRKDINGQPIGFQGIARDITERKQAESDRKKLEAQLLQAQKMEAIGTLAGGIAHDFNNLLMGIQGRASLLLMDDQLSQSQSEQITSIEEYVQSAATLTRQLLGFARGGKYEVKPVDLNALIAKQNQLFGRARKEIHISETFEKLLWPVEVDQRQIEQVLLNLYVNAWQAMPGGGTLYIQTGNIVIDENDRKRYHLSPGKYVKVSITDNGIGMDKVVQRRIFDPFFTTKENKRSSGLGLASAYGIIKNHDGLITVYSEQGEGTTFNIYLPISENGATEGIIRRGKIITGSETVLLIDDEDLILDVGQEILEKLGYHVLKARRGKEAITIFKTNKNKIDMVILDMIMPEMDGGTVYDELKKITPDIKVLLSSGYSVNGKATEIINKGCNGFIQKPFNLGALSKKVREILDNA